MTSLPEFFAANEPELELISYGPDHTAQFRLLDCDGYRLGTMVLEGVAAICLTTRWRSYGSIRMFSHNELPEPLHGALRAIPEHLMIVEFCAPNGDDTDDFLLPAIDGEKRAFAVCESVRYEAEESPGRGVIGK